MLHASSLCLSYEAMLNDDIDRINLCHQTNNTKQLELDELVTTFIFNVTVMILHTGVE